METTLQKFKNFNEQITNYDAKHPIVIETECINQLGLTKDEYYTLFKLWSKMYKFIHSI